MLRYLSMETIDATVAASILMDVEVCTAGDAALLCQLPLGMLVLLCVEQECALGFVFSLDKVRFDIVICDLMLLLTQAVLLFAVDRTTKFLNGI